MYAIIPVLLFIIVFLTFYFFAYHFARNYPSQRAFENGFRMLLTIAVLNGYFLLCFLMSLGKIAGDVATYYRILFCLFSDVSRFQSVTKVLFLLSAFLVHLGGVGIPLFTIIYLRLSSSVLLLSLSRRTIKLEESKKPRQIIEEMKSLFYEIKEDANIEYPVKFLLLRKSKAFDISSGCQIIKGFNEIVLIIDQNFLECFESAKINGDEIKAIFSHELTHIYHKDNFLPLLAKYLIYSVVPLPIVLVYSLAFLLSAIIKFDGVRVLWTEFLLPSLILFSVTYFVWIMLLQIVAYSMREREFLADARACESGISPEVMSGVLKKIKLLFIPHLRIFKAFSFASKSSPLVSHGKMILLLRSLKGEILLHPLVSERIKAIKEGKYFVKAGKIELLPFKEVVISTLLLSVFSLFVAFSFNIFQNTSEDGISVLFLAMTVNLVPIVISMLSCMPLRFRDARTLELGFIPGTPGEDSHRRAFLLLFSLFYNENWFKIHRNNIAAILITWFSTWIFLRFTNPFYARYLILLLPFSLIGCPGVCLLYIMNSINAKYRSEKGISPIIR